MKTREEIKAEIKRVQEIRDKDRENNSHELEVQLAARIMALRWTMT